MSKADTHTAPQIVVSDLTVRNEKGYATARTTHGFEYGTWYFEVILPPDMTGNIRLGVAQILAEMQAPVGYDEYGFAIRDKDGAAMHCGKSKAFGGKKFGAGDVIGVLLVLPNDLASAQTSATLKREMEAKYPPKHLSNYKVSQEVLADPLTSQVEFFLNGVSMGPAFSNIYKAKYYPAVSPCNGAQAIFNFGPDFRFECPAESQPAYLIGTQ